MTFFDSLSWSLGRCSSQDYKSEENQGKKKRRKKKKNETLYFEVGEKSDEEHTKPLTAN